MKGLLIKDLYMMAAYCKNFLLIIGAFMLTFLIGGSTMFFMVYPMIIITTIPVTMIAYDERSHWSDYCRTMPYPKRALVAEKYVLLLILVAGTTVLELILMLAATAFGHLNLTGGMLNALCLPVTIGVVSPCITLPCVYRYGAEKGRIANMLLIMLFCIGSTILGERFSSFLPSGSSLFLPLIALALLPLSWLISSKLYERRTA